MFRTEQDPHLTPGERSLISGDTNENTENIQDKIKKIMKKIPGANDRPNQSLQSM